MTNRRPPHKKSRQETQSTVAFFKPSTASSGATAVSGEATGGGGGGGGWEFEPANYLQDNSWDLYKPAEKFFWGGSRGTPLSCFSLLEIVTV
jgi:hypothetical protein